jgi:RNA polymerase sigma-70 factor, ECF subfamily
LNAKWLISPIDGAGDVSDASDVDDEPISILRLDAWAESLEGAAMPIGEAQVAEGTVRFGGRSEGFRRNTALPEGSGRDPLLLKAILRAKEGDRDALSFLYIRYADNVYGYVRSIVRDEHDAEDITQQLFLKLTSALSRYEPRSVPFAAWILRVARNLALDHLRAVRAIPCEEVRPVDAVADDYSFERSRALEDALDALPRDQRQVLILRHVAGMTPGEIARSLGKTEHAIHGLHHRGRRTLKRELLKLDAGPVTACQPAG